MRERGRIGVAAALALALYYVAVNLGWVPFAEICRKGEYGPPDHCAYHDFLWFLVLSAFYFASDYSGFFVALFTGVLWWSTHKLWEASQEQGSKMETSIGHAASAAGSMASLSASMAANVKNTETVLDRQQKFAKQQMRAYIAVLEGDITYQDIWFSLQFAATPRIRNFGNTPAHNIRFATKIDIVPKNVPANFVFSLPKPANTTATLVPTQEKTIMAIYHQYLQEWILLSIINNPQLKWMIWGTIWYDDVFGDEHQTDFSFYLLSGLRKSDGPGLWQIDGRHSNVT